MTINTIGISIRNLLFILLFSFSLLIPFTKTLEADQKVIGSLDDDYFMFYTTNNINIKGDVARYYGDNFNTGTLKMELKKGDNIYSINMMIYTQSYPELSRVGRVDVVELRYGKVLGAKYYAKKIKTTFYTSGQLLFSGNFGGEELQKVVHAITNNTKDIMPYSAEIHHTAGLSIKADTLYYADSYRQAFVDTEASINIDGSGQLQLEAGVIYRYEWMQLKLLLGAKYITPLKQELVEAATANRTPIYAIAEFGFHIGESVSILIGSKILGDNPYGNQSEDPILPGKQGIEDPYTYLTILYQF